MVILTSVTLWSLGQAAAAQLWLAAGAALVYVVLAGLFLVEWLTRRNS